MNIIYTVGHSTYAEETFFKLIQYFEINCIVDVRSVPYSRYSPQFNRENIKRYLQQNGISYVFMGDELGARRKDRTLYNAKGYLDFEKTAKNRLFRQGIERVETGVGKGYHIALMCTEKDPLECHRSILVAHEMYLQGYNVQHILDYAKLQSHEELEGRMLDLYFPDRMQQTLHDMVNGPKSQVEYLLEAYRLRNMDIGYEIEPEKEIMHA